MSTKHAPGSRSCNGDPGRTLTLTGNTYPLKEQIKALGGKWNPKARGWDFRDPVAYQTAKGLIRTVGVPEPGIAPAKGCPCYLHSQYCEPGGCGEP